MPLDIKRCPRCGRAMKNSKEFFYHCACGNSWMAGKGFFVRSDDMEFIVEEKIEDGVIIKTPAIRYRSKPDFVECGQNEESSRKWQPAPNSKDGSNIIRGGIYYIRKHKTEGSEEWGGRPAVVVSDVSEGDFRNIVTVVYLTSKEKAASPTRTLITSSGIVSTVLAEQVTTIDISRVGDFVGMCSIVEMERVKKCLKAHLALNAAVKEEDPRIDIDAEMRRLIAQNRALQAQIREQQAIIQEMQRKEKSRYGK